MGRGAGKHGGSFSVEIVKDGFHYRMPKPGDRCGLANTERHFRGSRIILLVVVDAGSLDTGNETHRRVFFRVRTTSRQQAYGWCCYVDRVASITSYCIVSVRVVGTDSKIYVLSIAL